MCDHYSLHMYVQYSSCESIFELNSQISHQNLFGLVYCVAHAEKTAEMSQFGPNFHTLGGSCAQPHLLIRVKFGSKKQTHGLRF